MKPYRREDKLYGNYKTNCTDLFDFWFPKSKLDHKTGIWNDSNMIVNVYSKLKSELIVVDILDENNRPVDRVESDKKYGNDNFAGGFNLEK